jgi:phosphoglycolate phosphatase
MIGNGVEKLVERALNATGDPLSAEALEREQEAMLDIYARHLTGLTTLLPGVREALDTLRRNGIRIGLATNKQQRFIETVFDHFGLSSLFDAVIGGGPGIVKKPAPDMLIMAMQQLRATRSDTVMVGDSTSDVQAAKAAGVRSVIVRGGYTSMPAEQLGADIVIDDMTGLTAALESLKPRS